MQELLQHLNNEGFYSVRNVVPDGKLHRFKVDQDDHKESGFYTAYENHSIKTGQPYYVMVYGSWRSGESQTFCTFSGVMTKEDRKVMQKKTDELKKKEAAHRLQVQEQVAEEVQKKLESCQRTGISEYLNRKQISSSDLGLYYEADGDIYVPLKDVAGKTWSFQKIQENGGKFFFPSGRVSGNFHTIGDPESSDTIYIAEGLATAGSVRIATGQPVVVAFNSANLVPVATALREKYPNKSLIICGDHDRWTTKSDGTPYNPGKEKAEEAAKASMATAIFPEFLTLVEKQTTDFNDLHVREGLEVVKKQLSISKPHRLYVTPLGFKEKTYFYTTSQNRQIVAVSRFTESDMLDLMPVEYWESIFPGGGSSRVDWLSAKSKMMQDARSRGIFQSKKIRGSGVWLDLDRVVVHMGDHLIVDGIRTELGDFKSRYFYTLGSNLTELHPKPLTVDECGLLVEVCDTFKWLKPDYAFLMAGGLVVNRVCGALPIRPHMWITGGAATGKTTLLDKLIKPMLGPNRLYCQGGTTEAGIRQALQADSIPLLFDEFETTGQRSMEGIAAVIELLRAAWSDSDAQVVKGSAGGIASYYTIRCCAIVSSIRTRLVNDADLGRFARVELMPHMSDAEHWEKLSVYLSKIDAEYSDRMFARTIKLMPVLLANYKTLKRALAVKVSQRFGDQYGMLLAGYGLLLSDEPLSDAQASSLVEAVELRDEKEESKISDHDEALTQLQTKKIKFERDGRNHERTLSELIISAFQGDQLCNEALQRIGIKVTSRGVAIASKHTELESEIFKNTNWSKTWSNSLSRLPNAQKNVAVKLAGKTQKCVLIPFEVFSS